MKFLKIFLVLIFILYMVFSPGKIDHLKLGDKYLLEGKISFAREEYNKALTYGTNPEVVTERLKKIDFMNKEDQVHLNAAYEFDKRGEIEPAIMEYKTALKINPDNIKAMNNLMINLFKIGKNDDGLEIINKLSALGVENASIYYCSALYEYRRAGYDAAADKLKKCFMLEPNHIQGKELSEFINKKKKELALKKMYTARELFLNGVRHLKNREYKVAALEFQDSLSNFSPEIKGDIPNEVLNKKIPIVEEYTKAGILFNLATANEFRGNYDDAISALEKINDNIKEMAVVYYKIYENQKKSNNDKDAYATLLKVEKLDPDFYDIYSRLGFITKKIGLYEEAITYFKKASELDSQNPLNFYNLAIMYKKIGKNLEAIDTFERTLAITANDSNLKFLILEQLNLIKSQLQAQNAASEKKGKITLKQ